MYVRRHAVNTRPFLSHQQIGGWFTPVALPLFPRCVRVRARVCACVLQRGFVATAAAPPSSSSSSSSSLSSPSSSPWLACVPGRQNRLCSRPGATPTRFAWSPATRSTGGSRSPRPRVWERPCTTPPSPGWSSASGCCSTGGQTRARARRWMAAAPCSSPRCRLSCRCCHPRRRSSRKRRRRHCAGASPAARTPHATAMGRSRFRTYYYILYYVLRTTPRW